MLRVVEPEILDRLPAADPAASRSRADLVRLNSLMGHARLIASRLQPQITRVIDLGAGDGTLLLKVLRSARHNVHEVILLDQQPVISQATCASFNARQAQPTVVKADVIEWLGERHEPGDTAIVANLFLHHFPPNELERLLSLAANACDLFIACEPRRSALSNAAASLLGLIGCNHVTRHDAVVSVRAGFRGAEISALWPDAANWQLEEHSAGLFSHLFVAQRV
jgi:hypothetical protein